MHIAWLGKKSPFCGNVTYGREITNALLERDHRVSFFHFATDTFASNTIAPNTFAANPLATDLSLPADPFPATPEEWDEVSLPYLYKSQILTIPNPRASKVFAEALRELQPDLVHASLTLSPLDFGLPDLCQELGIPLVATFHPAFDRRRRNVASRTQHLMYQIYAPFLANYDRTIIFSEGQRDLLCKLGVPAERVAVIPNGVDTVKYAPGPSQIKEELKAERLFVYLGRISPEKNVEAMLKAWKQAQLGPKTKLVMVGDGPLASTLKSFYHAEHGVIWLGFVADEQRRIEILRGADVFILPSLIEGLSLSLLEAMACGCAAIATDVGADGEVLADGAGIALAANKVTSELLTLLPVLRDQTEFTQLLGIKARQRVLERYTLTRNLSHLEALYTDLVPHANPVRPDPLPS